MFSWPCSQRNIDLANLTKPSPLADPYHALLSASTLSDPSQQRLPRHQGRHSLILSPRKTRPRQCQATTFCEMQRLYAVVPDPDSTSTPRARSVTFSSCPNTPAHQLLLTLGDPPLEVSGRASRTCSVSRGFPALSSLNSAPWSSPFPAHLDLQIVQHLPLAYGINRHLRHKIMRAQEVRGGILVLVHFLLFAQWFSATVISWWISRCTLISNGFFPCNCAPGSNDAAAPAAAGAALPW